MIPLGQLLRAGSVNPTEEEQKRAQEMLAVRLMLEQARSPQAMAQKRMNESDARNESLQAGRAAILAKYGQPIDIPGLMAKERSSEYAMLHDPGITRGRPARLANPVEDVPANQFERTPEQTALEAKMNQRTDAIKSGALVPKKSTNDETYKAARLEQRVNKVARESGGTPEQMAALRERLMGSSGVDIRGMLDQNVYNKRKTNAQVAMGHNRLNAGTQEVLAGQGLIPNLRDLAAKRMAQVSAAGNRQKIDPQNEAMSLILLERLRQMQAQNAPPQGPAAAPQGSVDVTPGGGTIIKNPPQEPSWLDRATDGTAVSPSHVPPAIQSGLRKILPDGTKIYIDADGKPMVVRPGMEPATAAQLQGFVGM